jgi:D-arginine dehydrogenase
MVFCHFNDSFVAARPRPLAKISGSSNAAGMSAQEFDILVIGAGMAGASAAAELATAGRRVALLEAEEAAGYHSTGRSAAIWILNYGPPDVHVLTGLSRAFFETPPPGFVDHSLIRRRPVVFLAPPEQSADLASLLAEGEAVRQISLDEIARAVPALRPDYAVAAAIEDDAFDIDVAALHQGFLRQFQRQGGRLALSARARAMVRTRGLWQVETADGARFAGPILVNAAGAWGDEVAKSAGVAPLGLTPKRRTGAIIDPAPYIVADWPLVQDVVQSWYVRPEARSRLMVTPADATPTHPHDVQPDEIDIAIGIDRMQRALAIDVRRVERSWAGLRTFTPDGSLAFGWDPQAEGFFWCVGQGGYGIQTAPAAGRLVAALVLGQSPGAAGAILPRIAPRRFA